MDSSLSRITPTPAAPPAASEPTPADAAGQGLAAELRESLLLLGIAVTVTVGVTAAAQGALAALG